MQPNHSFQILISSLLILVAPSVLRAQLTESGPSQECLKDPFGTEQEKDDCVLKEIDNLCRGKIPLPENIQKQLKCRYVDNGNPFLKLAPFKEEEAYLEPRIVIFHNVIYDEEIEILKKVSQPPIKLVDVKACEETLQPGRIGQVAWIQKENLKILEVLLRRTGLLTRLLIRTSAPLQVFYYRIGGMYLPHFDFSLPDDPEPFRDGNRVATLMYYLNDVEKGGRTVFTRINVSLTPKKGTAVFWHNLTPNGIGDPSTIHAGCPVIAGTKWVATSWFHESNQDLRRPCTLENQPAIDWERESRIFE